MIDPELIAGSVRLASEKIDVMLMDKEIRRIDCVWTSDALVVGNRHGRDTGRAEIRSIRVAKTDREVLVSLRVIIIGDRDYDRFESLTRGELQRPERVRVVAPRRGVPVVDVAVVRSAVAG